MNHFDDDTTSDGSILATGPADERELELQAAAGDREAFDRLYDRYFTRLAWYFTIFSQREAKAAVGEVMVELFGSLAEPSDRPLARRAYDLARATEIRRVALAEARATNAAPVKVDAVKAGVTPTPRWRA